MCFAPQRRALFRHLNFQKWSEPAVFWTLWLGNVLRATTASTYSTSELPKVVRESDVGVSCTFWLANVLRATTLFRQLNFQNCSEVGVLCTFDLEMCFAPQRRALFRHLNFQKWSEREVLLSFLLTIVLRATTACNLSSLIWPAGSAPAALARLLFHPPEPQIIGLTQWIATFLPFRAPASSCFPLFLFSDLLTSWLLLSDSSHLCFSISAFCRKFDFKISFDYIYIHTYFIYIYIQIFIICMYVCMYVNK